MNRRDFLQLAAAGAAGATLPWAAQAQSNNWPTTVIRLIVPFPPGGGTDTVSRLVAEKLTVSKKWQLIVDNRPGAAGNIGLDQTAKAKPDGYTLAMAQTSNMAINPALYPKMLFDPLKDLKPIVQVCAQPVVLVVRKESPFKTLADFIAAAKKEPGKYTMAQAGMGTVGHLAGEMLTREAGIDVMQVPYKGAGPGMNDLMGGQVDTYFGSAASVMPQLQAGAVRGLATTSAKRLTALPDLPTVAEQGYKNFEATTWLGLVGPDELPDDIVKQVNAAVVEVMSSKEVQERLEAEGNEPNAGTPEAFATLIRNEYDKWGKLIREANIKIS
ncbi:Bug family tripartite tricarboxylate transporter substrate binding protein [Bordetella muralis]|jgi:tripartite-type tricarboxylate transporter receptor subunit TctC|uniref:Bug family tripartite tricarboxylate transporter substrate binding protein n=1 Tax=Bordetella muralis TaxID=1649130 RepID=UPI0039EE1A54